MLGEYRDGDLYIEGLKYNFPTRPTLKTIRNANQPRSKQKWSRHLEYEQFDWEEDWEDRLNDNPDQVQYLVEEIDRINDGEWIYVDNEAVYLNNYMYFFLQWFQLEDADDDDKYPKYRETSLYYYRFVEIVDKTKLATGHTLLKARRLGATSMIMSRMLLKLLTVKNKNFGITSKTADDAGAEGGAFGFLVNAFKALPVFLKPQMEGNDDPKKVLSLKKQAARIKKGQKATGGKEGLGNRAMWRAPSLNTFDSGAYEDILVDESGKYPKDVPISSYLGVVTKCVKKGARVTGKLCLPTTVNPPDKGGSEYRIIWDGSDQSKADYLGQTKTGLYRIMIPAYYGFDGYIDEYGNSVWEDPTPEQTAYLESTGDCPDPKIGAKQYLQNTRDSLENDPEKLQEEIQMNPFNAEEVFDSSNNRCLFDLANLNTREKELIEMLEDLGRSIKDGELGRRGWFHKLPNKRVEFFPDDKGIFYVQQLLPEEESNKYTVKGNGEFVPANEELGAAGLDPVASGEATVDAGSDACLIIRNRYSSMNPDHTGIPICMAIGRMTDVNKFYEQIYNCLQYYGVKMLAERAPISWHTYAVDNGLLAYLYGTVRSDGTEVKGIVGQGTAAVKDEHAEAQVLSSLHDHNKIKYIRLVRDRKFFNVQKRTEYDACMADGYAIMALKIPFKKAKKAADKKVYLRKGRVLT